MPLIRAFPFSESPTEGSSGNCPVLVRKMGRDNRSSVVRPIFHVPDDAFLPDRWGETVRQNARSARQSDFWQAELFGRT